MFPWGIFILIVTSCLTTETWSYVTEQVNTDSRKTTDASFFFFLNYCELLSISQEKDKWKTTFNIHLSVVSKNGRLYASTCNFDFETWAASAKSRPDVERYRRPDVSKATDNNTLKDSESSPAAKHAVTSCNLCFVGHIEHTKAAYWKCTHKSQGCSNSSKKPETNMWLYLMNIAAILVIM